MFYSDQTRANGNIRDISPRSPTSKKIGFVMKSNPTYNFRLHYYLDTHGPSDHPMADFVEKSARYKDDRSMRQMELIFLKGLMDKKRLSSMKKIAERSFNF